MNIDLIKFPGAYISLSAITAISDEHVAPNEAPVVHVDYGQGSRLSFEGSADDVMKIINAWQLDASARAAAAGGAPYGTPVAVAATA